MKERSVDAKDVDYCGLYDIFSEQFMYLKEEYNGLIRDEDDHCDVARAMDVRGKSFEEFVKIYRIDAAEIEKLAYLRGVCDTYYTVWESVS